jgi:hypothetical protein
VGYNFAVGNAVPKHSKEDFPELYASWEVEGVEITDAPCFPNDVAKHTNYRSPSYTVWANFCRNTGLYEFFYDENGRLHAGHPGCIGITKEDADFVTAALNSYRAKSKLPPGFEEDWDYQGPPNYDYDLARLMWLEWWMQWAVKNCETPAIENS